jgi:hypothetical protein
MALYELSDNQISDLQAFLSRTTLEGKEALVYLQLLQAISPQSKINVEELVNKVRPKKLKAK